MNDEQNAADRKTNKPFARVMQNVMGAEGEGCACTEMMERFTSQKGKSAGCADMMAEDGTHGVSDMMGKCMKRCRWFPFIPLTMGIIALVLGYFLDAEAVRVLWLVLSGTTVLLGFLGLTIMTLMLRK